MPARRRLPGSESDDNFSIVTIGSSAIVPQQTSVVPIKTTDIEDNKKYIKKWNYTKHSEATTTGASSNNNNKNTSNSDNTNYLDDLYQDKVEVIELMMTCRDRSTEFANAIRSLQGRNISRAVNIRDPKKATQLQSYSEFMMIAKHIGKNIANTYSKLEKLTLCKYSRS